MYDELLSSLSGRLDRVEAAVRGEFGSLTPAQLNWRPAEGAWGVGHCLEHLMKSNAPYFPIFSRATSGTWCHTFAERLPWLPRLWGRIVYNAVKPATKRKTPAPKMSRPTTDAIPGDIVDRFCMQQRELIVAMQGLKDLDLYKFIITSPLFWLVTYNLRDAVEIIVAHEERHLLQAQRALANMIRTED